MTLEWPSFRVMARRHWLRASRSCTWLSIAVHSYARSVRYVPEIQYRDIVPAWSGVQVQAVARSGELVDDFQISKFSAVTAVRNAPSPVAISSMAIAEVIAKQALHD
jgi:L-2-hydroxyglutarate oxidase LhgO